MKLGRPASITLTHRLNIPLLTTAGIVNAVEVVNSFTGDDALMAFRRWVLAPDADAIKAAAKKGRGRGRKKGAAVDGEGGSGYQVASSIPAACLSSHSARLNIGTSGQLMAFYMCTGLSSEPRVGTLQAVLPLCRRRGRGCWHSSSRRRGGAAAAAGV
jgi:hypothetical protein